jgi:hypothetical protein
LEFWYRKSFTPLVSLVPEGCIPGLGLLLVYGSGKGFPQVHNTLVHRGRRAGNNASKLALKIMLPGFQNNWKLHFRGKADSILNTKQLFWTGSHLVDVFHSWNKCSRVSFAITDSLFGWSLPLLPYPTLLSWSPWSFHHSLVGRALGGPQIVRASNSSWTKKTNNNNVKNRVFQAMTTTYTQFSEIEVKRLDVYTKIATSIRIDVKKNT